MSDIKNLFATTFSGFDLTQFPESDLIKLGVCEMRPKETKPRKNHKKVIKEKTPKEPKCCAPKERDPFKKYGKIVPIEPSPIPAQRFKYKHININDTEPDKIQREMSRSKLYYHAHREELKYKRLVKQGRYEVIELLLSSLPD